MRIRRLKSAWLLLAVGFILASPAPKAAATQQVPENIHVNGRVLTMASTPLTPLLEKRQDLKDVFKWTHTGCYRGYVGTWHVEGDRLLLVSLHKDVWERPADGRGRGDIVNKEIPLSILCPDASGPVQATWYSGTLRISLRGPTRTVHMGFGSSSARELELEIVKGRVIKNQVVNRLYEERGRSGKDMRWVALANTQNASQAVEDDGRWTDARSISTAAFRTRKPAGTPFVTRGVLDKYDDDSPCLWIPRSLVTPSIWIRLETVPGWPVDKAWPHVEITAIWKEREGTLALEVRSLRFLRPGETIHHLKHPLPELTPDEFRKRLKPSAEEQARDPMGARRFDSVRVGNWYEFKGTLETKDGQSKVEHVDVGAAPDLEGRLVLIEGVAEKWIITERLLALDVPEVMPFRSRGPGTYYRMVDPFTGELVTPRPGPKDEVEKEAE